MEMNSARKCFILAVLAGALLCGCKADNTGQPAEETRFKTDYVQLINNGWSQVAIIEDTETGCKYLYVRSGYSGGLTRLE